MRNASNSLGTAVPRSYIPNRQLYNPFGHGERSELKGDNFFLTMNTLIFVTIESTKTVLFVQGDNLYISGNNLVVSAIE